MPRSTIRAVIYIAFGLVVIVSILAFTAYRRDTRQALARINGRSTIVPSAYGQIEFSQGGEGPPVLIVHGSGGGFDQGTLIADYFLTPGFHWIAPSRFGYLRSTHREGATFDEQAHAYAALLDHLGIKRVGVVAFSHGGPSALLFAALHPERVTSLTLVSAGVASVRSGEQEGANEKGNALVTVFRHNWLYWGLTRLFRGTFMELMGAPESVTQKLSTEQRRIIDRIIDEMMPTGPRLAGVMFDNRAALPGERIAAIRAPTLIFHADDDTLQLVHNAEFAAAKIPDARLVRFDQGGHLVLALQHEGIRAGIREHILQHSTP